MEDIMANSFLEFRTEQMTLVRQRYNLEKPGDMSRAVDVLEDWIKMQPHFCKKELPRNYLEKTIIASKGSLERATIFSLDKICTFRTLIPDFFGENLTKNSFDDLNTFSNTLLPKPTKENYRVYFLKSTGSNFTFEQVLNCYRYMVLICEFIMAYDYSDGVIAVVDYTEANLIELIKALNLTQLRQIVTIVTEGFGMRLKGIHLLTESKSIDTFVSIIKQLISAKLADRIFVHKDVNTLHKYVPKEILPAEYGGDERPLRELRDKLKTELTGTDFMNYIEEMNSAKTNETYRQADTFNEQYIGVAGSFRSLNVD